MLSKAQQGIGDLRAFYNQTLKSVIEPNPQERALRLQKRVHTSQANQQALIRLPKVVSKYCAPAQCGRLFLTSSFEKRRLIIYSFIMPLKK